MIGMVVVLSGTLHKLAGDCCRRGRRHVFSWVLYRIRLKFVVGCATFDPIADLTPGRDRSEKSPAPLMAKPACGTRRDIEGGIISKVNRTGYTTGTVAATIIIYIVLSRYLVQGLLAGSMKT
jgi:hypothetical protein